MQLQQPQLTPFNDDELQPFRRISGAVIVLLEVQSLCDEDGAAVRDAAQEDVLVGLIHVALCSQGQARRERLSLLHSLLAGGPQEPTANQEA